MAIAFDNSLARQNTASTTLTTSFTTSGSDRALVVYVEHPTSSTVTCTYAGVSMTAVHSAVSGGLNLVTAFILLNPASGANNIVSTRTGGANDMSYMAASYTGVGTGGGTGGSDSGNTLVWASGTSNQTIATVTVADNAWISHFVRTGSNYTPSTNVTSRQATGSVVRISDTGGAITPAGSTNQTLNYVSGGSNSGTICTIGLAPVAAAPTFIPRVSFIM